MYKAFLIKYAEIGVKGKNRDLFEEALVRQIKYALKRCEGEFRVRRTRGRIYIDVLSDDYDYEETIDNLKTVCGVSAICPMVQLEDEGFDKLCESAVSYMDEHYSDKNITFKVNARRARKNYPVESMEINASVGEKILQAFPEIRVDVHNPDVVYFHAPPYTSERAKQKVVDLAKLVARYSGPIYLHVINFTEIQLAIYEKCPHDELTIIMRRYMMKIAEDIAKKTECLGLITGESIGQVASQTIQSLAVTNEVCTLPVFRPCIGLDKQEIVEISEKIGTYETSILPFEDCCTIFVAKHPVTKPNLAVIKRHEENLKDCIDEMMQRALDTEELIVVEAQ